MDFMEAPSWYQDEIIELLEDKFEIEFDWDNDRHMEMAQEAMCDNLCF